MIAATTAFMVLLDSADAPSETSIAFTRWVALGIVLAVVIATILLKILHWEDAQLAKELARCADRDELIQRIARARRDFDQGKISHGRYQVVFVPAMQRLFDLEWEQGGAGGAPGGGAPSPGSSAESSPAADKAPPAIIEP